MSIEKIKDIGLKIAKAISSIHKLKVIHGDLKPENILVTENDEVKICDFASSVRLKEG
jgi:serine/threonine protein kinase